METCRIGAPDAAALDVDELGTDAAVSVDQTSSLTAEASARAGGHDGSRGERRQDANGTRRRQREELAYLRERAAALEQELALLRADCLDEVARDPVDAVVSPSPWERIAARQREARRNAEKENDRLRRDVEAQLRLAKSLERLLRKRPGLGTVDEHGFKRACNSLEHGEDSIVYGMLLERIGQGLAVYESILSAVGLFTAPADHRETRLLVLDGSRRIGQSDVSDSLCVQLTDVTVMPFGVEATASAAWRCITSGYMQLQHQLYRGFEALGDVLALQYSITMTRRRLRVDVTARAAMRRFAVNDSRDVLFVWESQAVQDGAQRSTSSSNDTSSASSSSDGAPRASSVQVRERGWTLFAPTGDGAATRMLTCMQMLPLVSTSRTEDQRQHSKEVGVLTDLALEYFDQQIDHAHHAIETLLLDEA